MFTEAGCGAALRCCEQTNGYVERNVLCVCVCTHTYHSSSSSYTYSYSSSSSSATASSFFDGSDQKLPSSSFNACATAPPTTNARSAVRKRRAVQERSRCSTRTCQRPWRDAASMWRYHVLWFTGGPVASSHPVPSNRTHSGVCLALRTASTTCAGGSSMTVPAGGVFHWL